MPKPSVLNSQKTVCQTMKAEFVPPIPKSRIGFARQTIGKRPINGLRHPGQGDMNGWYVWFGDYSDDPNFFGSLHVEHLDEVCPEIVPFLALPPGYRFLIDGEYRDVWFDSKLLVT